MNKALTAHRAEGVDRVVGAGAGLSVASLLLAILLVGCAKPPQKINNMIEFSSYAGRTVEISGWIDGGNEFQFYFNQDKIGDIYNGNCVSGVLSSKITPNEFYNMRGKKITIEAKLSDSRSYIEETMGYFHNYCDRPFFLIVTNFRISD